MVVDFLPESVISVFGSRIVVKALPEHLLVLSIAGHMCCQSQLTSLLETLLFRTGCLLQ
jgi:hypothetical protein